MQTNAPAGGEWVDQFNRAVAYGQINIDQAGLPAHASTHAVGGSDPVSPASIGAASTSHASTHATGGSDSITPASIGAITAFSSNTSGLQRVQMWSSEFDLRQAADTLLATLFTVPSSFRFLADNISLLITAVTQTGTMSGATQPGIRAVTGSGAPTSANHLTNSIELSDGLQAVQVVGKYWRPTSVVGSAGSTTGKATAVATDVVSIKISTGFIAGTNGYTVLKGKSLLTGWLIPA